MCKGCGFPKYSSKNLRLNFLHTRRHFAGHGSGLPCEVLICVPSGGKEKLSVAAGEPVRLVLESDGTQVEDGDYWRTLPPNTVLLLLRPGERWYPTGVDVIKAAISAIPKIVCETIHALELHDETPSWKIMDNKGRVTVVLHWDQRPQASPAARSPSRAKPDRRPSLVIQTSVERPPPPHITVVNHDEPLSINKAHYKLGNDVMMLYTNPLT
ncbi:jg4102 [Pararge aegeria aegeria]|uniref:Jg4102 protein n=1 Tax=Pararge aegeria aegeria TaxID=348720 RepID=A0A8S4RT16_9NEOP|nr:jg4102 [Pararge aegeria aegeria]